MWCVDVGNLVFVALGLGAGLFVLGFQLGTFAAEDRAAREKRGA